MVPIAAGYKKNKAGCGGNKQKNEAWQKSAEIVHTAHDRHQLLPSQAKSWVSMPQKSIKVIFERKHKR